MTREELKPGMIVKHFVRERFSANRLKSYDGLYMIHHVGSYPNDVTPEDTVVYEELTTGNSFMLTVEEFLAKVDKEKHPDIKQEYVYEPTQITKSRVMTVAENIYNGISKDIEAMGIVKEYVIYHLDKSDEIPIFDVYTVWKSKILQNWKYLISTTLPDGMYYELTYNGDKDEWYLDAYKKFDNACFKSNPI